MRWFIRLNFFPRHYLPIQKLSNNWVLVSSYWTHIVRNYPEKFAIISSACFKSRRWKNFRSNSKLIPFKVEQSKSNFNRENSIQTSIWMEEIFLFTSSSSFIPFMKISIIFFSLLMFFFSRFMEKENSPTPRKKEKYFEYFKRH